MWKSSSSRIFASVLVLAAAIAPGLAGAARSADHSLPSRNGRIAFERVSPGSPVAIYTIKPDGSGLRRLSRPGLVADDPAWSPDGRQLAFRLYGKVQGQNNDLYLMRADGSGVRRLTNDPDTDQDASWSPDGRRIAYDRSGVGGEIWVIRVDGSHPRRLTTGFFDEQPTWSPDGKTIAFVRQSLDFSTGVNIWVMRPDGSGQREMFPGRSRGSDPVWSPDGTKLVFTDGISLYTVTRAGSLKVVTELGGPSGERVAPVPAWSPDGRKIVFAQLRPGLPSPTPVQTFSDLWVINADGSGRKQLTTSPLNDYRPSWQRAPVPAG